MKCVTLIVFLLVRTALYYNNSEGIYKKQDTYAKQKCYIIRNNKNTVRVTYKI